MSGVRSGRTIEEYYPTTLFTRRFPGFREAVVGLDASRDRLREMVDGLSRAELHRPLTEGGWSLGEVVDHLILVNDLCARALDCVGKEPLELPRGMLSDAGKAIAPSLAEPRAGRSGEELIADLDESTDVLINQGRRSQEHGRLDEPCMIHGFFGRLTALECLQFQAWHMRRHLRQLTG